jgi:multimeric flavodoxin WrbA
MAQNPPQEVRTDVRFISLASSPYTGRHDSLRAGLGIYLLFKDVVATNNLGLTASFHDGSAELDNADRCRSLLEHARVVILGSSTWVQGSSQYLRRFFEQTGGESLTGVAASAWATAGGFHTGGETVISDTLRSLMGMGAQTFTLGQKLMVFTTEERVEADPGKFTSLDCWYMDQFARRIAVVALAANDHAKAEELGKKLGATLLYYSSIPLAKDLEARYAKLAKRLNDAANSRSTTYAELLQIIAR